MRIDAKEIQPAAYVTCDLVLTPEEHAFFLKLARASGVPEGYSTLDTVQMNFAGDGKTQFGTWTAPYWKVRVEKP